MSFAHILSQQLATGTLARAAEDERVASSYLFDGPGGVGKQLAAIALAQAVNCTGKPRVGCGTCNNCTRIAAGTHPDVRIFAPRAEGSHNIQVEFLREEILPFARYAPFEEGEAFLIFPQADVSFPASHPEAANALLKTLEEPRPRQHFILLAERADQLLPTTRSRCQRVHFARLDAAALDHILTAKGVDAADRATVIPLADGRADVALALLADGLGARVLDAALRLDDAVNQGGPGNLVALADELAKDEELPLILQTLSAYYRDIAALDLTGDEGAIHFRSQRARIVTQAPQVGAARASARAESLRGLTRMLDRNANRETALTATLFELQEARG